MPCAPGKELRNFQTDPPPITVLPAQGRATPRPPRAEERAGRRRQGRQRREAGQVGARGGDASERKHVRLGMTEAEVLAKLGQPDMTTGSKNGGAVRWTYMPAPGDPETITALTLTKGAVTDIERKVVKK